MLGRCESMPSAAPSTRRYYVVVTETRVVKSVRGSRRCQNPFRLSSGGCNGLLFRVTRLLLPDAGTFHFVSRSSFFLFSSPQSQGHGGAHRSGGRQGRERLQADLRAPDGPAAGQLHRGVHQEPNGAVMEPNTPADIHMKESESQAPGLELLLSYSPGSPSSSSQRPFKARWEFRKQATASPRCKPIALSDALPRLPSARSL